MKTLRASGMVALFLAAGVSIQVYAHKEGRVPTGEPFLRITEGQHRRYVTSLELSPTQVELAGAIYDKYHEEYTIVLEAWTTLRNWVYSYYPSTHGAYDDDLSSMVQSDARLGTEQWQRGARQLERWYFDEVRRIVPDKRESITRLQATHFSQRVRQSLSVIQDVPQGARLDLSDLIESAGCDNDSPEIGNVLATYSSELQPLLEELDGLLWRYQIDRSSSVGKLRKAEPSETRIHRKIERFVARWIRPYEVTWQIQVLNEQTLRSLSALVSEDCVQRLHSLAWPDLYPYAYEKARDGTMTVDRELALALRRADLSPAQIQSLDEIRGILDARRLDTINRNHRLYNRVYGPEWRRQEARAWVEILVYDRPPHGTPANSAAYQELEQSVQHWGDRVEDLRRAIHTVVSDAAESR